MKKPQTITGNLINHYETARQKIAEILFNFPDKEFSLSELAKLAGVKKSNIGKILSEFQKAGFIEITKLSTIWRIRANRTNLQFQKGKVVHNFSRIYESGIAEFLASHFNNTRSIILFGAFRKGEDNAGSSVDIAVETSDNIEYQEIELDELREFEQSWNRKINLHLFSRKNININQLNLIANGIVLHGVLQVNNLRMDFIA